MRELPQSIRRAIDLAVNHHLIEDDEIFPDEDGCVLFERALREYERAGGCLDEVMPLIPAFSTTCWKVERPEASNDRISWPWKVDLGD